MILVFPDSTPWRAVDELGGHQLLSNLVTLVETCPTDASRAAAATEELAEPTGAVEARACRFLRRERKLFASAGQSPGTAEAC